MQLEGSLEIILTFMTGNTIDLRLFEVFFSPTQKLGIRILELEEIAEII